MLSPIRLLPALPSAWSEGELKGLLARGAVKVDIIWKDGKLVSARLSPTKNGNITIRYEGRETKVTARAGVPIELAEKDFQQFEFPKGK